MLVCLRKTIKEAPAREHKGEGPRCCPRVVPRRAAAALYGRDPGRTGCPGKDWPPACPLRGPSVAPTAAPHRGAAPRSIGRGELVGGRGPAVLPTRRPLANPPDLTVNPVEILNKAHRIWARNVTDNISNGNRSNMCYCSAAGGQDKASGTGGWG